MTEKHGKMVASSLSGVLHEAAGRGLYNYDCHKVVFRFWRTLRTLKSEVILSGCYTTANMGLLPIIHHYLVKL